MRGQSIIDSYCSTYSIIKGYRPCRRPRNSDRRWPKRDERQIFRPPEFVGGHLYHCVSSWFCSGSPICISVFTTVRRSWLNMTAGRCLVHTTYALIVENETLAVSRCRLNERRWCNHKQKDSSPNLPKPSPVKLSNVAFWRPKETERWCNQKQRKPQQCNHKQRNPRIATTSETRKPQQDSSPRGSQFVPWRAAETASSKPLKANQNHGKPWQDLSPKRKPIRPEMVLWGMHAKHGSPSRIQVQGVASPDGLPKQHLGNR